MALCGAAGREALFEEELSEEQVEAELAPLAVQLAYAAALQGRRAEALAAYEARPARVAALGFLGYPRLASTKATPTRLGRSIAEAVMCACGAAGHWEVYTDKR